MASQIMCRPVAMVLPTVTTWGGCLRRVMDLEWKANPVDGSLVLQAIPAHLLKDTLKLIEAAFPKGQVSFEPPLRLLDARRSECE